MIIRAAALADLPALVALGDAMRIESPRSFPPVDALRVARHLSDAIAVPAWSVIASSSTPGARSRSPLRHVRAMRPCVRKWLPAALCAMTMTACATIPTTVIDSSCTAFGPITYSASRDTPETIRQVREHNAAWRAVCGEVS